jgi:hypothetical protein
MTDRLKEIEESVRFMRLRLESGQGTVASAMCRLKMSHSEWLIAEVKRLREERNKYCAERCELWRGNGLGCADDSCPMF